MIGGELEDGKQDQKIAEIMIITTSCLGLILLLHGFVRDYLSFGIFRLECYTLLALSYIIMSLSKPSKSDNLQYFWIIQQSSGVGLLLNGMQMLNLFPKSNGFLIGLGPGCSYYS